MYILSGTNNDHYKHVIYCLQINNCKHGRYIISMQMVN